MFDNEKKWGGVKNITSLFNTYGDNTSIASTIFGTGKWSYFKGFDGGTTDNYFSATSSTPHYVEFITGSYHSGAGDGQVDGYYKVFYKTTSSGEWIEANFNNGVWEIKQKIQAVRVFFHVQSTSSAHYPNLGTHKIIGRE